MGSIFHYLNSCIVLLFIFSIFPHFSSFKTHIRLFSSTKMFTVAHFNKQDHYRNRAGRHLGESPFFTLISHLIKLRSE